MLVYRLPALPTCAGDVALAGLGVPRGQPARERFVVLLRAVPQIEVTKQAYLRTVVDDLQVRIQDELRHGLIGEFGPLLRALPPGKSCCAEAAHTVDPHVVRVIEQSQRFLGGARVTERRDVRWRTAEMGRIRLRESDDQVREPLGDRSHRLPIVRRLTDVRGELSRPREPRRRARAAALIVQQSGTGCQKHSSLVSPSSRGRS
jgi:hypothetical protein